MHFPANAAWQYTQGVGLHTCMNEINVTPAAYICLPQTEVARYHTLATLSPDRVMLLLLFVYSEYYENNSNTAQWSSKNAELCQTQRNDMCLIHCQSDPHDTAFTWPMQGLCRIVACTQTYMTYNDYTVAGGATVGIRQGGMYACGRPHLCLPAELSRRYLPVSALLRSTSRTLYIDNDLHVVVARLQSKF